MKINTMHVDTQQHSYIVLAWLLTDIDSCFHTSIAIMDWIFFSKYFSVHMPLTPSPTVLYDDDRGLIRVCPRTAHPTWLEALGLRVWYSLSHVRPVLHRGASPAAGEVDEFVVALVCHLVQLVVTLHLVGALVKVSETRKPLRLTSRFTWFQCICSFLHNSFEALC